MDESTPKQIHCEDKEIHCGDVDLPDLGENTKKGSSAPRPYHKPTADTRKTVMAAVGMGLDQKAIGALLDITPKTLRKFYRNELDTGAARANLSVAKSLYGRASGGKDTVASIFWLKARAGWQDTVKTVHEGLPENITVTFALPDSVPEDKKPMIDVTPSGSKSGGP